MLLPLVSVFLQLAPRENRYLMVSSAPDVAARSSGVHWFLEPGGHGMWYRDGAHTGSHVSSLSPSPDGGGGGPAHSPSLSPAYGRGEPAARGARLQRLGDLLGRRLGFQQARVLPAEDHDDADVVVEGGEVDGHPAPLLGQRVVGLEAEEAGGGLQGAGLRGQVQRRRTWDGRALPSGARTPAGPGSGRAGARPRSSAVRDTSFERSTESVTAGNSAWTYFTRAARPLQSNTSLKVSNKQH